MVEKHCTLGCDSMVTQLWNPTTLRNPTDGDELELHDTKSQKALIDTAVKASQMTVFFDHELYPSMERLINSDSTVQQLWDPNTIRNPEDGDNMLSEMLV
jgi:hypothetical protein